jgi:hypothetical protein
MEHPNKIPLKTEILYNALNKKQSWYTGIAKKKYIIENIFNIDPNFYNKSITSNLWSTYAHFSKTSSLLNLLEKNQINQNSTVILHPLLPADMIQTVMNIGCKVIFGEISKNTLNFHAQSLIKIIENKQIDVVINFSPLGIYSQIQTQTEIINEKHIPIINCILDQNITLDLLSVFESLKFGAVIFIQERSLANKYLNTILESHLPNKSYYLSWQIEERLRSILEYHLSESHIEYQQIVEAYYYLLVDKQPTLFSKIIPTIKKNLVQNIQLKSTKDAQNLIHESWKKIENLALPDIFFELENFYPTNQTKVVFINLQYLDSYLNNGYKNIYQFFQNQIQIQPRGTLEIPEFQNDYHGLYFHFYTTNINYWQLYFHNLQIKTETLSSSQSYPNTIDKNDPKINFIKQHSVLIKIKDLLEKNIVLNASN